MKKIFYSLFICIFALSALSCSDDKPTSPESGQTEDTPLQTGDTTTIPDTDNPQTEPGEINIENHNFVISSQSNSYLLMTQFDHNQSTFESIARIEALSTPMPYGVLSAMNQDTIISLYNGISKTYRVAENNFSNFSRAENVVDDPSFLSVINRNVAVIMSSQNSKLQIFNPTTLHSSYEVDLNEYKPYMAITKNSLLYIAVEERTVLLIFDPLEQAITDSISIPFADPFLIKSFDETHLALGSSNPSEGGIAKVNIETGDYEILYDNSANSKIPVKYFDFDSRSRLYFLYENSNEYKITRYSNNNHIDIASAIQDDIFFFFLTNGYIVINTAFNSDEDGFENFSHSLHYYDVNTLDRAVTTFNLLTGRIDYKIQ